jgi:hypothetical protein
MLREGRVTHVAPERLGPCTLGAKAAPFSIAMPTVALGPRTVLGACPFIPPPPRELDGVPGSRSLLGWPNWRQDEARAGEDVVPTVGCSFMVLCRLALEQPELEMETSAPR